MENCKSDNTRDLLFNLYKRIEVKTSLEKQIDALDSCLEYLTTLSINDNCEKVFYKVLEKIIKITAILILDYYADCI